MADAQLRKLERQWRQSGTVEDEAAYLRERERSGGLSRNNLELAAFLGHESAFVALSGEIQVQPSTDYRSLIRMEMFGKEALVRAALTATQTAQQVCLELCISRAIVDKCIESTIDWLQCPCYQHLVPVDLLLEVINEEAEQVYHPREGYYSVTLWETFWAASWTCRTVILIPALGPGDTQPGEWIQDDDPSDVPQNTTGAAMKAIHCAHVAITNTEEEGADRLIKAIKDSLLPWTLGYEDPLTMNKEETQTETP